MKADTYLKLLLPAALIAAWQFSVPLLDADMRYLFPPPSDVWTQLLKSTDNGLLNNFGVTVRRIFVCVGIGGGLGAATGLLMGVSKVANITLDGIVAFLMPIPKIAVFPFFLVVFGFGETARLVPIALSAYFPMLVAGRTAAQSIDPHLVEVCKSYDITGWLWVKRFLLPSCMPVLLSGLRLATTTTLIVSVAVEMLASNVGIGSVLWLSWQTMQMEQIFAGLFLIGLFGMLINGLIGLAENKYLRLNNDS